jgi:hypothetical protein
MWPHLWPHHLTNAGAATVHSIAKPISDIFNISLSAGIFPDNLKLGKVLPIHKSDDKTLPSNYRPISVLSVFSKILERLMYNRLIQFLTKNNILSDKQFGFRKNHSTSLALVNLIDRLSEQLEHNYITLGIFIDLSKAFDTINHKILLDKLCHYGVQGIANNWFKSYLNGRKQYVQIGTSTSNTQTITCGVPQGSILGPLLFLIYVNDITVVSRIFDIIMFADDTNLFIKDRNMECLVKNTNDELSKISKWFKLNKLSLNIKKTSFILFQSKKRNIPDKLDIRIDNIKIEQVKKTKFLGVIINETLTWDDHIFTIKQKVQKNIGIIHRIKKNVPSCTLPLLYQTLVHPYLEYCNIVWAIHRGSMLNNLFKCQKRAIRTITYSKMNAHTKPLFSKLNILSVFDINNLQVACFMYNAVNALLPIYFNQMFEKNKNIHAHNTRQSNKVHITSHRLDIRRYTVRISGPLLWNSLPKVLTESRNLKIFKRSYKQFLLQNAAS